MFVESAYVTKPFVEPNFDFKLHNRSSGVWRLHKNAVRLQKGMTHKPSGVMPCSFINQ